MFNPLFSRLTYNHLKDILKALHAEEINLQSARKLIELLHEQHTQEVNEVIEKKKLYVIKLHREIFSINIS